MKGRVCVDLTVAVTEAGMEAWEEEFWQGWEGPTMTEFVWIDEEVGLRENEIRDEASVTIGWVEFLRLMFSARLSEEENN